MNHKVENLTQILNRFRAVVPQSAVIEFSIAPLDYLNVPLWGAFAWSPENAQNVGFGYGSADGSFEIAAQLGAWGEVIETYVGNEQMKKLPRRVASYSEMTAAIDPVTLCLDAGCGYTADKKIIWTRARKYPSNEEIWLPIEAVSPGTGAIAGEIADDERLFMPVTNGLGAGGDLAQALSHGILEIFQRDGNGLTFRAMDAGIKIELDDVRDPETLQTLEKLDKAGIEVIAKFAGTVCGVPVIHVVGYDRDLSKCEFVLQLSACGEAAHPDREIALGKALREFVSSRSRKRFVHGSMTDVARVAPPEYLAKIRENPVSFDKLRALKLILKWLDKSPEEFFEFLRNPIFAVRETIKFSELPTQPVADARETLDLLTNRLTAENFEIIYADLGLPERGIYNVKAVVPGLEVETMSYNRIGKRNFQRLVERGKTDAKFANLVGVGNAPETALPIYLNDADAREIGAGANNPAWIDAQAVANVVGEFFPLYREPAIHTVGRILAGEVQKSRVAAM